MKRTAFFAADTDASHLILACPLIQGRRGVLLAYDGQWVLGVIPGYLRYRLGLKLNLRQYPVRTEIDHMAPMALDSVAGYMNDLDWQQHDGIRYGFSPAGKAQLMRNMLEVLRRRGNSNYVNFRVIPQLMRPLDHPAGPDEVPGAKQIIRKGSQFY